MIRDPRDMYVLVVNEGICGPTRRYKNVATNLNASLDPVKLVWLDKPTGVEVSDFTLHRYSNYDKPNTTT
jgi:hypothetical protein